MDHSNQSKLRDDLCKYYDKTALLREASKIQDWKINERSNFLSLLQKEHKQTLLEVGAGVGRDGLFFQDHGLEITCIDLSPVMVELCRQKGLIAYVMDVADMRFPDAFFDSIYSMNSLLHLPKTEFPKALREIDRLLKQDGLFFLGVYGGFEHEGIYKDDFTEPKRFFSFFTDEQIQVEATQIFNVESFNTVIFSPSDPLHFQSLVLRKR